MVAVKRWSFEEVSVYTVSISYKGKLHNRHTINLSGVVVFLFLFSVFFSFFFGEGGGQSASHLT